MADRYWRGGTASWDGTAGSKWADSPSGPTGASVPTTADDVYFDSTSSGVVTIAAGNTGAKSINCTGFTGTITGTATINVAGSITLASGMTYTHTGIVTFTGTGTLTTAGKTFSGVNVTGSGITLTLGDALTTAVGQAVTITNGSFNSANYNITCNSFFSSNSNTRTITLGSSTVTILTSTAALDFSTSTNLTFNAGTSQINFTNAAANLRGGSRTFYNVAFTSTTAGTRSITGMNTINNFSVTGPASAGIVQITFDNSQTINGTLSTNGTAGNMRVWFRGATYGTRQILYINSAASLTDADFRDIYVLGTVAPISGTRVGNRGYCGGIIFDNPRTVYWNLSGAQNWSANGWASTPTGTPSTDFFPLPQDIATFTNSGSVTGTITLDGLLGFVGNVDMSARTTSMTISIGSATTSYGNWINGSGTTISGTQTLTFSGDELKRITSAGKTFTCPIAIDAYDTTVELADALVNSSNSSAAINIVNGTFDTKGYSVTIANGGITSSGTTIRQIKLGASTLTLGGSTPLTLTTPTNLTFDAGTSQITCGGTGSTFNGGSRTFYNVTFNSASYLTSMTGSNTFNNLTINTNQTGLTQLSLSADQTVTGTFNCAGSSATQRAFIYSNTTGTPRTITAAAVSANDCDFRDIVIAGAAAPISPTRGGNCGGNSGITFPSPKTVYWNLSGSQNWSATGWATTSTGTPDANNFPLAQDTATFTDSGSAGTISINASWNIGELAAGGRTSAMTLTWSAASVSPSVHGNFTLGTGVTISSTSNVLNFTGRGTQTVTSNGVGIDTPVTINCITGTVQLADALSLVSATRALTLTSGTFNAVSYNVTVGIFSSTSSNTRSLKLGSGLWTITGTSTVWGITATNLDYWMDTADILFSNTSTSLRVFDGGGLSYNKVTIGGATGTSTFNINGNNSFSELASTKTVAHTIALGTARQAFGKWSVTGTAGAVVTLTGTTTSLILAGDATENIDYLAMGSVGFDSSQSPAEFYAGANSTGTAASPVFRTAKPAARTLYWVGGTGNWSSSAKWSLTSGGAGGEAPPTSLDDVIFNSASNATAYTSTIDAPMRVKSLTITGPASGNLTLAGSSSLSIHQSISYPATGFTRSFSGAVNLSGTGSGKTINTNGIGIGGTITLIGYNSSWSMDSAGGGSLQIRFGELSTNGYSYSGEFIGTQNANFGIHRTTLNLGSSTVTLSGFVTPLELGGASGSANQNNITFNAGTSTINFTSSLFSNANISISNKTLNTLNITFRWQLDYLRTLNFFTSGGTINNLTITRDSGEGTSFVDFYGNITFGNISIINTSYGSRNEFRSSSLGTIRTVTINGTASIPDCDFRDLAINGSAAPIAPTRASDCGNNSGITFPAPKTVYRVGDTTTSYWYGVNAWATTSGGAGSNDNFPLAQDTAVIDNSSGNGQLFDSANYNMGNWDFSQRTTSKTFSFLRPHSYHGNITLGSGMNLAFFIGATQTFVNASPITIISAGKNFIPMPLVFNTRSKITLGDAFTLTDTLTHNTGEFDANGYNVTVSKFFSNNSNVRTLKLGYGTWTLTGTGTGTSSPWDLNNSTNLTLNKGTATLLFSDTSTTTREFRGGNLSYPKLTIGGATGISDFLVTGTNSFTEIASTKTVASTITFQASQDTIDTWTAKGSSNNVLRVVSSAIATRRTFNLTNITSGLDYLYFEAIGVNQRNRFYAGSNSTDGGNVFNVNFNNYVSPTLDGKMLYVF